MKLFTLAQNWESFDYLNRKVGKCILIHSFNGILHDHYNICYDVYAKTCVKGL